MQTRDCSANYLLSMQAFKGCHGVFVSTDTHSAKGDPHEEFLYGKNASDAAKQVCAASSQISSQRSDSRLA